MKQRILSAISLILACAMIIPMMSFEAIAADEAAAGESYQEFRPEFDPFQWVGWEDEEIYCQSGENTLRGVLTVPKDVEGQMPVAILLHGLNTTEFWCADIAWALADNGIASVRFDFSGNGKSDGAQEDMSVSSLTMDTRAIIDFVQAMEITDQENIFIVGKSMGAVAAMLASKSEGENIKSMCLWYPGFSVKTAAQFGFLLGEHYNPFFPPETLEVAGFTYGRQFLKEIRIMDYESACQEYEGSVMIIHGTDDMVVPLHSSLMAQHLFQDCTLNVVPGGRHGFWGFQEMIALGDMVSFFKDQLE